MGMSEQQKQGGGKKPWYRRRGKPAAKPAQKMEPPKPKGNYAFIDSQNLNLGVQKMGWKMDWHKLRLWLAEKHGVTHAYMFIGYMQENEALYEQMYAHGFLVVLKPTLEIKSPSQNGAKDAPTTSSNAAKKAKPGEKPSEKTGVEEKSLVKGNIDADLVLYAMKELPNYDKAVIISGDGDFFSLVEYLANGKKLAKVFTPNRRYSTLLKDFEPYIEDINTHRRELAYRDFRRAKSRSSK